MPPLTQRCLAITPSRCKAVVVYGPLRFLPPQRSLDVHAAQNDDVADRFRFLGVTVKGMRWSPTIVY